MQGLTLALLATLPLSPAPRADDAKDPEVKLKDYLAAIKGTEAARVTALTTDGTKETFPDHDLFAVSGYSVREAWGKRPDRPPCRR